MREQMTAEREKVVRAVRDLWRDELSTYSTAQQPTDLSVTR